MNSVIFSSMLLKTIVFFTIFVMYVLLFAFVCMFYPSKRNKDEYFPLWIFMACSVIADKLKWHAWYQRKSGATPTKLHSRVHLLPLMTQLRGAINIYSTGKVAIRQTATIKEMQLRRRQEWAHWWLPHPSGTPALRPAVARLLGARYLSLVVKQLCARAAPERRAFRNCGGGGLEGHVARCDVWSAAAEKFPGFHPGARPAGVVDKGTALYVPFHALVAALLTLWGTVADDARRSRGEKPQHI